jgi:hypothetical protein
LLDLATISAPPVAAGPLLDGNLDAAATSLHGFHVQAPFGDQALAHDEDRDPTHGEWRSVHVVTAPVPLAPLKVAVHRWSD